MKLVIIGGGGFRVPQVIEVLADPKAKLRVNEVVLYDVEPSRTDAIMAVLTGSGFLNRPTSPRVSACCDLSEALTDANFVFSAMRIGGTCGRITDERVGLGHGVLGQETVGAGGYAYALRTVPAAVQLAQIIKEVAPDSWTINFTNPAGIITQAMRQVLGRRVVGICDTPIGLMRRACAALGVNQDDVDFDYVGLNHLGWLRTLVKNGEDLLPGLIADDELLDHMEEARTIGGEWIRALGMLPNEYLFYYYLNRESLARIKKEPQTRGEFLDNQQRGFYQDVLDNPENAWNIWNQYHDEREATYMAESRDPSQRAGRRSEDIAGGGYQEVALGIMESLTVGTQSRMILNVGNADCEDTDLLIPELNPEAVVEVPCLVDAKGIHPQKVAPVTGAELGLITSVKACEELIIDAALQGDKTKAWRAFASHPLVDSVLVARKLLDEYCEKNPLIAEVFTEE
ncbi:6-phospho-beta-glucosidase [Varibaculum cambriense]|uniref:6-phospho-beta-glucosidase n=1 Tax=Varibaculum cambriense TaxID=184870 RepID=UPI00291132DE|nr:6-phospho-beta-glucosidase [Varibaculum cambriense]MDU5541942.1 6-phospho-beta-glucosidase [Varibaculum cambriense]